MNKALLGALSLTFVITGCSSHVEDDEDVDQSSEAVSSIAVAPALQFEFNRIKNTRTGQDIVARARARGLHTIKVGPLGGNIVGLYQSNGVITIESPNNSYTF